jgi:hypothetical protein
MIHKNFTLYNSIINGWIIINGRICFNINDSDYEIIQKVDQCNKSLFVYGKKNQSTAVTVYNNFKKVFYFSKNYSFVYISLLYLRMQIVIYTLIVRL